jgi:2,3-bisphosphoglycerate-independent phosphoglycerate mutase
MKTVTPTALIILDGFGISPHTAYNAIAQAKLPFLDFCQAHYPHTTLHASGSAVGLLAGVMGNSQAGHLTIGSGRVVPQGLAHMSRAIEDGTFFKNTILHNALEQLHQSGKTLHVMGLLSDAGVHSHIDHLFAFLRAAQEHRIQKIVVHAFLDGRDVAPQSAQSYLQKITAYLNEHPSCMLGSITGRFYTMDRDSNWERTAQSYTMLTHPQKPQFASWQQALSYYYQQQITDEFIPPTLLDKHACVEDGDGIIFFNARPDRAQQLTRCFVEPAFDQFPRKPIKLAFFITPYAYSSDLKTTALFVQEPITDTLKEVLSKHHKAMFTIAETEKYAHVTYFFSGGKKEPFPYETQRLIDSIPVQTYAQLPDMSAPAITHTVLHSLKTNPCDFYLINYANADMVGHSGNLPATARAIECLDAQLAQLYAVIVQKLHGTLYITGDHGNAEYMYDEATQQPCTSHTTNPVPFILVNEKFKDTRIELPLHSLADIAPFILHAMKLPVPKQMREMSQTKKSS